MHTFFRGESDLSHTLLSSIGRKQYPLCCIELIERKLLEDYKAAVDIPDELRHKLKDVDEDLFFLAHGRHMGLDCRLLDWTASYNTAYSFAATDKENINKTGAVWALQIPSNYLATKKPHRYSPFQNEEILRVVKIDFLGDSIQEFSEAQKRRWQQNSVFTLTKTDLVNTPLEQIDLGDIKVSLHEEISPENKRGFIKRNAQLIERFSLPPVGQHIQELNQKYSKR